MEINFKILDSETDCIAEQYAYNPDTNGDKEGFVLELFKKFGRDCILSKASREASLEAGLQTNKSVDNARAAISF